MIGLLLGGAAFTFKVKHDSEIAIERVTQIQNKIKVEQDAIEILKADWSLLIEPKRLKVLVERYKGQLDIDPIDPQAIGQITEIPIRPPHFEGGADNGIAGLIEGQPEQGVSTGSIIKGKKQ